jgi:hypothetical protein
MIDFWVSSGHLLLDKNEQGHLAVTDEFIKLYLARPELVPPEEACAAERGLHERLLAEPQAAISSDTIGRIADADARENWLMMTEFRDLLVRHGTIEAAYLDLMRSGVGRTPPLFVSQLAHVIVRNVLDGETDPMVLRAGELMFRPQRLTREQGGILLADEELVDGAAQDQHASPLIAMLGEHKARQLDVMTRENAEQYWKRSEQFDMVLDFSPSGPARAGLASVMERWLGHLLGLTARIAPVERVEDDDWFWFVPLDAEATRIGNALWQGKDPGAGALERIVALYTLELPEIREISGRPIHLILAMSPGQVIRMKPQNLLTGLPGVASGGPHGPA